MRSCFPGCDRQEPRPGQRSTSHSRQRSTSRSGAAWYLQLTEAWYLPYLFRQCGTSLADLIDFGEVRRVRLDVQTAGTHPFPARHSLFPACHPLGREAFHLISIYRRILTSYRGFTNHFWQLYPENGRSTSRIQKKRQSQKCNCLKITVEIKRFELLTPCLQSRCSTN